jgi:hypothetical protein
VAACSPRTLTLVDLYSDGGLPPASLDGNPAAASDTANPAASDATNPAAFDAANPASLLRGLVGLWHFDDPVGSTVARDSSGNGNDGTLVGLDPALAWVTGRQGGALAPSGLGYVSVADSASIDSITTEVTLSAWVYFDGVIPVDYGTALSRQIRSTNEQYYHLSLYQDGTPTLFIGFSASIAAARPTAPQPVVSRHWTHMAGTYDGSLATLYVDGVVAGSRPIVGVFPRDATPLILSGNGNAGRRPAMKPRNGAIAALLFLTTCNEAEQDRNAANVESSSQALGKPAASEVATWKKVGGSNRPDGRYLQAVTFDETRKVAVMFGGLVYSSSTGADAPNQETWEWSPAAGEWTNRTTTDARPAARSGAAMVFDSQRNKIVLFGGRAGSGYNYQDTWEWDPTSGIWTDMTKSGSRPSARSQHAMVYQKSTGTILLYGGGRSDSTSSDGSGISVSFGDTWEWDPVAHTWASANQPTVQRRDMISDWSGIPRATRPCSSAACRRTPRESTGIPPRTPGSGIPRLALGPSEPPKEPNRPLAMLTRWHSPGASTRPSCSAVGTSRPGAA